HLSALLLRPPPWSTLFPSTTLFRSEAEPGSGGLAAGGETRVLRGALGGVAGAGPTGLLALLAALRGGTGASHAGDGTHAGDVGRSEEHTSELQSRENLVCRRLLEKK